MEVIRTLGVGAAERVKENWGGENPRFGRWLPCQGVDIVRNGEYVQTVPVQGVKQHPTDNYYRIEVEYTAGREADTAIDITADRQTARITSPEVIAACGRAYQAAKAVLRRPATPADATAQKKESRGDLVQQIETQRKQLDEQGEQIRSLMDAVHALMARVA
jgi:hypothetical protein